MPEAELLNVARLNYEHWARSAFGVAADAADDEARRAVVAALADDAWYLDPSRRLAAEAVAVGGDAAVPGRRIIALCYVEAERRLRPEVEAFAEQMFRQPVAERVKVWYALWERTAEFSALQARLKRLQPGLKVALPASPDETTGRLIEAAMAWFTARPGDRAELRGRIDGLLGDDGAERLRRVAEFRRQAPDLSLLTPTMFDDFAQATRTLKDPAMHLPWRGTPAAAETRQVIRPIAVQTETSSWQRVAILVGLAIGLINVVGTVTRTRSTPSYPSPTINFKLPENLRSQGPDPDNVKDLNEWLNQNRDKIRPGSTLDRILNPPQPRSSSMPQAPSIPQPPRLVIPQVPHPGPPPSPGRPFLPGGPSSSPPSFAPPSPGPPR